MPRKTPAPAPQPAWLQAALDYVPQWMAYQVERYKQVGCTIAIAGDAGLVAEFAFGSADLSAGTAMTPRHRLRIASHSKAFTAAGVMLLREQGKLGLDDPVGRHVGGLHKALAQARVGQVLSHGAGIVRDGDDSGQFSDRRPFFSREELRADLAKPQPLEPGLQLKYSNHGYGLLGIMIEEVTGTGYGEWMQRHVIGPAGLGETAPDMPQVPARVPFARGHTHEFPFGTRLVVPGDNACDGIAPAGGYVATAADVARFFAQLSPEVKESILSPASRREMMQRRWRDPVAVQESHYGLGLMLSAPGPREWVGHTGSLQGYVSRTARYPGLGYTITVLCNAADGLSWLWVEGIVSILEAFREHGVAGEPQSAWKGRWWGMTGAVDLVPMGELVYQVSPAFFPPFDLSTSRGRVTGQDMGIIHHTSGYNSPGQPMRLVRGRDGQVKEVWLGGVKLLPREALVAEMLGRYEPARATPRPAKPRAGKAQAVRRGARG